VTRFTLGVTDANYSLEASGLNVFFFNANPLPDEESLMFSWVRALPIYSLNSRQQKARSIERTSSNRGEAGLRAEPRLIGAENRPVVEARGRFGAKRQKLQITFS